MKAPAGERPQPKRRRQAREGPHGQAEGAKLRLCQRFKARVVDIAGLEPQGVVLYTEFVQ